MREIKIRGYSVEKLCADSQWVEGFGVLKSELADGGYDYILFTPYGNYEVFGKSVGQFTGLKDKNGKEIYEGDIVYIFDDEEQGNGWGETVFYHRACFMAGDENLLINVHSRCAVIGNIYENPNLLKGES